MSQLPPAEAPAPARTLARTLTLTDLVMIGVGTVIGSGIFLVPATVLQQTQGVLGVAFVVWIVAGILSVLGALTYGELGAMKPEAGGIYVYVRDAFGPFVAFLYGWALFFVISSGSIATLIVAFTAYLQEFVALDRRAAQVIAVILIAILAAINVRGTRTSAQVQNVTTMIKASAIVALSLALIATGTGLAASAGHWWPGGGPGSGGAGVGAGFDALDPIAGGLGLGALLPGIGIAMVSVLWSYEGWQYVTFSAGEAEDAQRTFPRALIVGTTTIVAIYLLANVGYLAALGPDGVRLATRVAAESATAALGPWAGKAIALAILISMFSAANGLTLTAPRVYFAMARDGLFFERLARLHPRFGTPAFAIISSSAWAAVLAISGTFEQLLTYVVFTAWIFYALGGVAVFYYRRTQPQAVRPFRVPGYPVTPLLFILSAAGIVINTLVSQPGRAAVGVAILLVGTPAYFVWRGRAQRAAEAASAGAGAHS